MMRAVIFVIIVVVIALLVALASGWLHVNQVREATAPKVSATRNGITAKGGQPPAFDVQTGSVQVGTRKTTVKVPDIRVTPPADADASNQAAPAQGNGS